ncbi:MAG: hypothetical protein ACOYNC_03045 [Bacteroidales bacterium]
MKKFILVAALILFAGIISVNAQHYNINPIPSYNVQLTDPNTAFQEIVTHTTPSKEKREMDVIISSSSTWPVLVWAKVWVVKENGTTIKGPYYIFLDRKLSVPIDYGQWGVVIQSSWSVSASVWID